MKRFTIVAVALTLVIIFGGVFLTSKSQNSNPANSYPLPAELTYYWGDGCPHCKIVADFLSSWDKKDAVKLDKKEVWNNVANAKELKARYEYCKVPQSEMGVPLLFTPDGKCFSGDTPIIDYLKNIK
jgi:glutaredoxin